MAARERLQTLEEFVGAASSVDCRPSLPLPEDTSQTILVTIRTVSGDAVFGPEPVYRGTVARTLKQQLRELRTDSLIRLLHGQFELRDDDLIEGGTRSGTLELSVLYTMQPTEEERQLWVMQLDDGHSLAHMPAAARADHQVVLSAVVQNPESMQHAAAELRSDREFMMTAVRSSGQALRYADKELRRDSGVVMASLEYDVTPLRFADRTLLADRDFVLSAVALDGLALRYADSSLRCDRQVVRAAIAQDEDAVQFTELEGDRKIDGLRKDRAEMQLLMWRAAKESHETATSSR